MAITDVTERNRKMEAELEQLKAEKAAHDNVNHPPHYTSSEATCDKCGDCIECIEVTRHMPFCLGNAVKYLWRWNHKGGLEDLKKARWYLEDAIKELERKKANEQNHQPERTA